MRGILEFLALLLLLSILRLWWRRKMRREKWCYDPSFAKRDISDSFTTFTAYAEDVVKEKYVFELVIYHARRYNGEDGFVSRVRVKNNRVFSWNGKFHLGTRYETWQNAKKEGERILEEKIKEDRDRW